MAEFVRLEVADGVGTIRARPAEDERAEPAGPGGDPRRRRRGRPSATTSGPWSSTAARRSSRPAPTSRRWPTCPTRTWSSAPAGCSPAFTALARIPKPVVAAVTGYALGGGCELALCADIRIAADDATLGQPEILLGIIPGAGGTQRLTRLVGPSRAKDLIFTGRFVKADEALAIGLVDRVVPADEVYDEARRVGRASSPAPRRTPSARPRRRSTAGIEVDLDTGLEIERQQFAALFATEDRSIGMDSFVENGPGKAQFEGR